MCIIGVRTHLGLLEDAEDGAGADSGVDVGGTVKGVEHSHELAVERLLHEHGVVFLLGGDHAKLAWYTGGRATRRAEGRWGWGGGEGGHKTIGDVITLTHTIVLVSSLPPDNARAAMRSVS